MIDVFGQSAAKWFRMPRVVRNFLYFLVQPAATQLLLPALSWLSKAVASFNNYDWRDGIEERLVEYLLVCWQRERKNILADLCSTKPILHCIRVSFPEADMLPSRFEIV